MSYSLTYRWQLFARIIVALLLSLLMSTTVLHAQQNNRPNYQLLWRIDGPGMSAPSYLFGTMHLTDKRVFDFSDSVLIALRNASSFAMEVDMDSMMSFMFSPGGPLLDTTNHMRRILNKEEYRYVDSLIMEKTGKPMDRLNLKRLWFIEKLLLDDEEGLKQSADANQKTENTFLDGWLHQKATGLSKPIHSLEKIQNQLHIMSAEVSEVQKEIFLWSLGYHNAGNGDAQDKTDRFNARVSFLDSLVNLYYRADLQKISNLVGNWQDDDGGPGMEKRNREMSDNLALLINKGSVFAAVGVAHLPGEKGMLSLLRAKGYSVTSVKATFTGIAKQERQRMDSVKGYLLNRIVDGYSVMLPGTPIAYPIPNVNRKMYIGNNTIETCFAFSLDIPQIGTDKRELVNSMINNMATQTNAVLEKSYPITYRGIPGTEALLLQEKLPFYIRLFLRNNRVFIFMYSSQETDSTSRKEFFNSVRFYDIVRPMTVYDTLSRPQLGFSAILPSDVNHVKTENNIKIRPQEIFTGLDEANNISYILRIDKMHNGFYSLSDKRLLEDFRISLRQQDSTGQFIDSTITQQEGLPLYRLVYKHANGYISRLHIIPRGNLSYCLLSMYDGSRTDSSYWKRFFDGFHILPLKATPPSVSFMPADSSFMISGPEAFTLEDANQDNATAVKTYTYKAMDSASHSMYLVAVNKYSPYYYNEPDSLLKTFLHPEDTNIIVINYKQSTIDGLPVFETEMKSRFTSLHFYRKAVVAGHTIYGMTAIIPEEVTKSNYGQQFLNSFRPGAREKADTLRLQQKKLSTLLTDLQSSDPTVFNSAREYLPYLTPDSTGKGAMINALAKPFPADTGNTSAKIDLLLTLESVADGDVVHAAEQLFSTTADAGKRAKILKFLSGIPSDTAIRTFLRLAPEMPENTADNNNIFAYTFKRDSLYLPYMPAMVATAAQSRSFLQAFTEYTSYDSLWIPPYFNKHGLQRLIPEITALFDQQLKEWKNRKAEDENEWSLQNQLLSTGQILALPGMPTTTTAGFKQLMADTIISLRALGARALINRDIQVPDKILNSIINDYASGYSFIVQLKEAKKLPRIRHLLTQELVARSYVTYTLTDEIEVTAIEQVTRIKIQLEKQPAEWLLLYRCKTDESEDWEYILNGPFSQDPAKFNFEPSFLHWIDKKFATDKKLLNTEATKYYTDYLENLKKKEE
jgi:uncharacterized protein YbaP (TraB family)